VKVTVLPFKNTFNEKKNKGFLSKILVSGRERGLGWKCQFGSNPYESTEKG
jgi:hypothetical protein